MSDSMEELLKFVQIGARLDLKAIAVEHILDDSNSTIAKDSSLCLVNISANEKAAESLLNLDVESHCPPLQKPPDNIVCTVLRFIFDPQSKIADPCCMILSNLTRPSYLSKQVIYSIERSGRTFDEIINIFTKKQYNKVGANLDYLGPVLSNLSQSQQVRSYILDKNKCVIQRLLPFTEYKDSVIRRGGVIGTLKNCCFESDFHEWLLSEEVDILPRFVLPLAGNEEFDEEDNDKLPLDLQYLPETKVREADPDIRCMLLEGLTQLCSKRLNREFIRDKNTYIILRELHKWEKDKKALLACENLVDILIRTEEEIGEDNLREIEVPEHLHKDFKRADQEFLKDD